MGKVVFKKVKRGARAVLSLILVFVMLFGSIPVNAATATAGSGNPLTGDTNSVTLWIIVMLIAVLGLVAALLGASIWRRRKSYQEEQRSGGQRGHQSNVWRDDSE